MTIFSNIHMFSLKVSRTRMHSSRMRTARSSSRPEGGSPPGSPSGPGIPPPGADPPGPGTPRTRHPLPGEQNDRQVQKYYLPQTSFAGGKKGSFKYGFNSLKFQNQCLVGVTHQLLPFLDESTVHLEHVPMSHILYVVHA